MKKNNHASRSIAHQLISNLLVVFFLSVTSVSLSLAAQYDPSDYESLLNEINSKGFVRVMVVLDDSITIEDMTDKREILGSLMKNKGQSVLTELGQNALKSGYWNNGIGQMGIYVNEMGLRILAGSNNAISFTRDVTHAYRIKVIDDDGSLRKSRADSLLFFNSPNTRFSYNSRGSEILLIFVYLQGEFTPELTATN